MKRLTIALLVMAFSLSSHADTEKMLETAHKLDALEAYGAGIASELVIENQRAAWQVKKDIAEQNVKIAQLELELTKLKQEALIKKLEKK